MTRLHGNYYEGEEEGTREKGSSKLVWQYSLMKDVRNLEQELRALARLRGRSAEGGCPQMELVAAGVVLGRDQYQARAG